MHKTLLTAFSNTSSDNLKSKIENRKVVGAYHPRYRIRAVWGEGRGSAAEENPRIGFLS